ncbi:MAG: holo-ACP synthase [Acidimicrobiia bacterium]
MTVLAVGLDVVDVVAFSAQLDDPASGFAAATFTAAEMAGAPPDAERRARYLAARFAAKEATIKAWSGARRGRPPALDAVDLREVEVRRDPWGRPSIELRGQVATALPASLDGPVALHLSLSHDGPFAAATVVLARDDTG